MMFKAALRSYGCLRRDRQKNRQFFSALVRGVCRTLTRARRSYSSSFGPDSGVQLPPDLRSSWKVNSANYFALTAFSEVGLRTTAGTADLGAYCGCRSNT